jgi:hypothetical protein
MRVWDVPSLDLCDRHLVAEHAEIHAIWSVITNNRRGYAHHPEVQRWRDNLGALAQRHDTTAGEMRRRGFRHDSPLPGAETAPLPRLVSLVDSIERQRLLLRAKPCRCGVGVES